MKSLWILGYGPLLVHPQFLVDYKRLKMTFNDVSMPSDCREGVRLLYDTLGVKYFTYTKYMNQTLGNYGYKVLKRITNNHIIVEMPSTRVHASSHDSKILFLFRCNVLDNQLKVVNKYFVEVCMDMKCYQITVDCRVYK